MHGRGPLHEKLHTKRVRASRVVSLPHCVRSARALQPRARLSRRVRLRAALLAVFRLAWRATALNQVRSRAGKSATHVLRHF